MTKVLVHPQVVRPTVPAEVEARKSPAPAPLRVARADDTLTKSASALSGHRAALDELWAKGKYADIVARMAEAIAPLSEDGFKSLTAAEIAPFVSELIILQQRAMALLHNLGGEDLKVRLQANSVLKRVGELQTAAFLRCVELQEASGLTEPLPAWKVYRNTLKTPGFHSDAELQDYLVKKAFEFLAKGGDLASISAVTPEFIAGLKSGELCEWTVNDQGEARITRAEQPVAPNHTILAMGRDVLSAGTLRVFKNDRGEVDHVVIGTFSGHFRPDYSSLTHMMAAVVAAGVPEAAISLQEGEAAGYRVLDDIVFKLIGKEGAEKQAELTAFLAEAYRWSPSGPPEAKKKDKSKGADGVRAPSYEDLHHARFVLQTAVKRSLDAGVLVDADSPTLAAHFDNVLRIASEVGDVKTFTNTRALVKHLLALGDRHLTPGAAETLRDVAKRWELTGPEGLTNAHADVLGQRPVGRKARIMASVDFGTRTAQVNELLGAGADILRIDAQTLSGAEAGQLISRLRLAAAQLGKPASLIIDVGNAALGTAGASAIAELAPLVDGVIVDTRSIEDVLAAKQRAIAGGRVIPVIARIKDRQAIEDIAVIAKTADALMLDRSALASVIGFAEVPIAERQINEAGNRFGRPTVIAVDGLASAGRKGAGLGSSEVEGVFSAVFDQGADCIMLERRVPPDALRAADRIIQAAEREVINSAMRYLDERQSFTDANKVAGIVKDSLEAYATKIAKGGA